jgi:hypothetical protein
MPVRPQQPEDPMDRSIILATDVQADPAGVFDVLSTTRGQQGFWTADCEVSGGHARADVTTEPGKLVRMRVTAGFPFWEGSTWEWELGEAARAETGTGVLFRHYGFGAGYAEIDFAHTAQTWALILARLASYLATGTPQPFFPAPA